MMIRPYRYNIAGLMAFVVCVGFGLAALRNADPYWGTGTYNVAFLSLSVATVYAIVGRGRVRSFSTGFAAFGFTYTSCLICCRTAPSTSSGLGLNQDQPCSWKRDSSSFNRISNRCLHRTCKASSTMTRSANRSEYSFLVYSGPP